jgi:hypothetical protein
MTKKLHPGGKGSWEYRFFSLVSPSGLQGEHGGECDLEGVLARAHGVTGVDLTGLTGKNRCKAVHYLLKLMRWSSSCF